MIGYLTSDYGIGKAPAAPLGDRRARSEVPKRIFRRSPSLAAYFQDVEILAVRGSLNRAITGLATDSRRVKPGMVYFATSDRPTGKLSGIDDAVNRGAAAVVVSRLPAVPPTRVTFIQVADPRIAVARVARRYFGFPDKGLNLVGVLGSAGKTSVSYLLQHLLNASAQVGRLGSVDYDLGVRTVPAFATTPDPVDGFGMLAQMRQAGCQTAIVEIDDPALTEHRVDGLELRAAVFSNLQGSSLVGDEFSAYRSLFARAASPAFSIVNVDTPAGQRFAAWLGSHVPATQVVTFGLTVEAMVRAEGLTLSADTTRFRLHWPGGEVDVHSSLLGEFHVVNQLGAIAAVWALGGNPAALAARVASFGSVPGRMEPVAEGLRFNVVVDSADTEPALRATLAALRQITPGRIIVAFGCDAHRGASERSAMTQSVQELADFAVVTTDDPRTEEIGSIFAEMAVGVSSPERITWVADRRRAIALALNLAKPGDCVLLAGRGHESFQQFAGTVVPFNDRQVARELLGMKLQLQT